MTIPIPSAYDPYYGTRILKTGTKATFAVKDGNGDGFDFGVEAMNEQGSKSQDSNNSKSHEDQHDEYSRKAMDKQLEESLDSTVSKSKPKLSWNDVAGLSSAKKQLQMAAEMPEKHPSLFSGQRKAHQFILLYGPPGTGKGHLAKALSASVKSTLYVVSASDLLSKWHGESERLVKLLFDRARRSRPAIVFFDEIDALCANRDTGSSHHDNRVKNEFLVQMDGVDKDNSGVLFLEATSLPWSLDPAFIRRFQKKIEVPLPDRHARKRLFELEIGDARCSLSSRDYDELAGTTEGFSGSDVKNLVQDALNGPITRIMDASHFRTDSHNRFWPCASGGEGAVRMDWRNVPKNQLRELPVRRDDFFDALEKVKPSVDPVYLGNYLE